MGKYVHYAQGEQGNGCVLGYLSRHPPTLVPARWMDTQTLAMEKETWGLISQLM